jgi:oxygen-dependent protoporphyrinogen oxidase
MSESASVLVVGAGLCGLACSHALHRAGWDVRVLEASSRIGGVVGSVREAGFVFEMGPHTLQARSVEFRRLCGELGIAHRLISSNPEVRRRYLWVDGRLQPLPKKPLQLLTTPILSLRAKLRILSEGFRPWKAPLDGVEPDMQSLLEERIGAEATRKLGGAFVRGIYAAELKDLGLRSAFPTLDELLRVHGSFLRGLAQTRRELEDLPGPKVGAWELLGFEGGLQELVDALGHQLKGRIATNRKVQRLERVERGWRVHALAPDGSVSVHQARDVVLALPAPVVGGLLQPLLGSETPGFPPIQHGDVVLVQLGFERSAEHSLPPGFGFLVPPGEAGAQPRALGVIFTSNLFPARAPQGMQSAACFYSRSSLEGLDERARIEQAGRDLALALGWKATPRAIASRIWNWNEVIPRYSAGHRDRVDALQHSLRARAPGLHLAGPWVGGVSVEQVIACGRSVAAELRKGSG